MLARSNQKWYASVTLINITSTGKLRLTFEGIGSRVTKLLRYHTPVCDWTLCSAPSNIDQQFRAGIASYRSSEIHLSCLNHRITDQRYGLLITYVLCSDKSSYFSPFMIRLDELGRRISFRLLITPRNSRGAVRMLNMSVGYLYPSLLRHQSS